MKTTEERIQAYRQAYAGKKLLEKYSLETYGIWRIRGEDPNADLHGPHHQPDLGIFEGRLIDVIEYAVDHHNFWQWGAGGDIEYIGPSIPKIDNQSNKYRKILEKEARDLEERLMQVNKELGR
jgi:hypothetical protein